MNPDKIRFITQTQLSVARYYGECTFNGERYIYDYANDTLIREKSMKPKEIKKLMRQWADQIKLKVWDGK